MDKYNSLEWTRQAAGMIAPPAGVVEKTNLEEAFTSLIKSYLTAGKSILEVGCIDGRYYGWLGQPEHYVGVDITQPFLDRARIEFPEGDFRQGDARSLDFPDQSFDIVVLGSLLMHLPDLTALAEGFRVARETVIFSSYANEPTVRTTHGFGFLNFWRPWKEFAKHIPQGWLVAEQQQLYPDWDPSVFLYLAAIHNQVEE